MQERRTHGRKIGRGILCKDHAARKQ